MVHHVTQELDAGEVIDFVRVPIIYDDTLETLRSEFKCVKNLYLFHH